MRDPRRVLPIIALLLVALLGAWLFLRSRNSINGSLFASGTVEAVEVAVSPEIAGRVEEVLVDEGEPVSAGQPLIRMNDELLQSQRQRAEAALKAAQDGQATAQAGLEAAEAALKAAGVNARAAQANTDATLLPLEQSLRDLYDNAEVAKAKAEQAVAAANRGVRETTYLLDNYTVPTAQQNLTALEAIAMTKQNLDKARLNFEPYKYKSSGDATRDDLKEKLDEAQSDYDAAVRRMEYEAAVNQAQAALDRARQEFEKLEAGPDPDQVATLEARLAAAKVIPEQAQSAVEGAQVGVAQAKARLEQANSQTAQAQAELNLVDVQIKKLTIYAAVQGVVIARNVEPGEVVQPGATALTLGQLDQLTITVYIPEDRYGAIQLGMKARVKVDSFPGKTFEASVMRIADQAEFTPRNVQTETGRKTTVFAIQLTVNNPDQRLKPGMPADVYFED